MFYVGDELWVKDEEWGSLPTNFTGCIRWDDGELVWLKNGQYYRDPDPVTGERLPERISSKGMKYWYNGKM